MSRELQANPIAVVRTPEGLELRFAVATASERLAAFVIDIALLLLVLVPLGILLGLTLGAGPILLLVFVARHGYFVWFEARGRGTTPGKRRLKLRVIRADGGPLSIEILLARNLTREVELFLPVMLLLMPDLLFPDHDGVIRLVASGWVLMLLFLPMATRERLRIGDLLAGTRVVLAPTPVLASDLADARPSAAAARVEPTAASTFVFTNEQLAIYGERELGVLEGVLRKGAGRERDVTHREALAAVTKSICRRIGWAGSLPAPADQERFLRAFYTAQRQHLEQQLLLGRRREQKRDKSQAPRPPSTPSA